MILTHHKGELKVLGTNVAIQILIEKAKTNGTRKDQHRWIEWFWQDLHDRTTGLRIVQRVLPRSTSHSV